MTYDGYKKGDIVCLRTYPHKLMEIVNKTEHFEGEPSICLKPYEDSRISYKWFTWKEFEDLGYILADTLFMMGDSETSSDKRSK